MLRSQAWIVLCCLFLSGVTVQADLVKLKTGGEVRGKVQHADMNSIQIESVWGASIEILRDEVEFLTKRSASLEEYETRAKQIPHTVDAHWELGEWCRQKSLTKQRELQLRLLLELDPEHERSHMILGHVKHEEKWVDKDELMLSRGYVKYKGKHVTQQEYDILQKTTEELAQEREWFQKIKVWSTWLTGPHAQRQRDGLLALQAIDDPHAAPAVTRIMSTDSNRDMRLLAIQILAKTKSVKAAPGFVTLTMKDDDSEVRYSAMQSIPETCHPETAKSFVKYLRNDSNLMVRRAAQALGRVGDEASIEPLIDALVTTHFYKVRVPGTNGNTTSFSTDGQMGEPGVVLPPDIELMLRAGQLPHGVVVNTHNPVPVAKMKFITIKQDHQNHEVLVALQKLTQQNFGFDERTWNLWWISEKKLAGK